MTERKKMLAGLPYCSSDCELRTQSIKANALVQKYNASSADDVEERRKILCELFESVGKNARVNAPITVDYGCNISMGDDSFVNKNCTLLDTNKIVIGNRVLIAPDVKIYTSYHSKNPNERFCADGIVTMTKLVAIGDDTWIGGGTIILPGVKIGSNVIVGAGSVVVHDIPDNVIAVGNPCRVVKENVVAKHAVK